MWYSNDDMFRYMFIAELVTLVSPVGISYVGQTASKGGAACPGGVGCRLRANSVHRVTRVRLTLRSAAVGLTSNGITWGLEEKKSSKKSSYLLYPTNIASVHLVTGCFSRC